MIDFAHVRRMMVDNQLRTYDITDLGVLSAMNTVPREAFAPAERRMIAYADAVLPVDRGEGGARAMLPPMIFARMLQELAVAAGEKVLIVAGALGYEAAVAARLDAAVTVLEPDASLAERTRALLGQVGADSVEVVVGPLSEGGAANGPYAAILVNGAVEERPDSILANLAEGGRLVAIVGDGGKTSRATLFVRSGDVFAARQLFDAAAPVLPAFRREPGFVF